MQKIKKEIISSERFLILLIIGVSLISVFYLLLPGFYEPQDLHHMADIYEMSRAILSGQFPPRFGPDFLYGFGYPLFNFYYPGPFYLGALIYLLGGNLRFSYEAIFEIGVILSSVGFYLFARNHFSKAASLAATVLYIFTPYKAVEIYVRGAMGEFLSLAFLPWILYFVENFVETKNKKWFILLAVTSFFTVISHNYFWVLIFGFAGFYFLIKSLFDKNYLYIKTLFFAFVFSILASIYWLLPAFNEQKLLKVTTPFPLIDHFPFIKQLLIPSWGYGASVWGPYDGMSFQLGVVNISAIVLAIAVMIIVKKQKYQTFYLWSFASIALCLFFMNSRSYLIWKVVPFYNLFQFPWRLLAFTAFFSSICAALVVEAMRNSRKKYLYGITFCGFIIAAILLTINYFKPSKIFYKTDSEYLQRFFVSSPFTQNASASNEYKNYSEDYLLLPKWISQKPEVLPTSKFTSANPSIKILNIQKLSGVKWQANLDASSSGKIEFYSLYFPGWFAQVDEVSRQIGYGKIGQIEIDIQKGDKSVMVYWKETPSRILADSISLLAFLSLAVYALLPRKKYISK